MAVGWITPIAIAVTRVCAPLVRRSASITTRAAEHHRAERSRYFRASFDYAADAELQCCCNARTSARTYSP